MRTLETPQKTFLCDMAKANACQRRAPLVGDRTTKRGLRWAKYRCPVHDTFEIRVIVAKRRAV